MNNHRKRPEYLINNYPRLAKCHMCKHNDGKAWGKYICNRNLIWPDIGQCKKFEVNHESIKD